MLSDKLTFLVSSFVLLSLSFSHYLLPLITELKKFFRDKKNYRKHTMSLFEKSTKKCTKSHNGKVMKQTTLLLSLLKRNNIMIVEIHTAQMSKNKLSFEIVLCTYLLFAFFQIKAISYFTFY